MEKIGLLHRTICLGRTIPCSLNQIVHERSGPPECIQGLTGP